MTTDNPSTSGTLRHRRKSPSTAANDATVDVTTEETEPLLSSNNNTTAGDEDEHHNDGYTLTPLIQRPMLLRLDVGPFLIAYLLLIFIDNSNNQIDEATKSSSDLSMILLQPTTIIFALLLLAHMMLVLLQQWNCRIKSLVGFQRARQTLKSSSNSDNPQQVKEAEALIASWTHCLVEVGVVSKNKKSARKDHSEKAIAGKSSAAAAAESTSVDAGIAPVIIRSIPKQNDDKDARGKVAAVTFHDITFRCPTVSTTMDQDTSLWKKDNDKSQNQNTLQVPTKLSFHRVQYPVQLPVPFYDSWKGHPTVDSVVQCQKVYGVNATILMMPAFGELLSDQVVAPFFLFQIFCVMLWSLDEYWYYAIFTLFALLSFESTVAYNRLQSLQRLRNASRQNNHRLWVHRRGYPGKTSKSSSSWMKITAQELVPGDLVSLSSEPESMLRMPNTEAQHEIVPADVLLLKGNAVVDEAMLTGESVPQIKAPFDSSSTIITTAATSSSSSTPCLDIQEHKESVLFGGTVLVTASFGGDVDGEQESQTNTAEIPCPPDGGVVGFVLRTGFETAQGSLLRTIAHSSKSVDAVHTKDTFVFIFLLVCCAIASASLVLQDGWDDVTRNRFRLVLHVIIIITSVIPPELPMELSLAVTNSVTDLIKRSQVFCTEHYRIPWAGLVDVCCFDKTGTLTSDQMRLKGIRLFPNDDLEYLDEESALLDPGEDPEALPWTAGRVMSGCHSLALRGANGIPGTNFSQSLIGDPLETAVVKDTGYQLVANNLLIPAKPSPGRPRSIHILHRWAFSSHLKRMTVLISEEYSVGEGESAKDIWALTKGAPETIYNLLSSESIPADYHGVSNYHMSRGRRVLAMAYRALGKGSSLRALKDQGRENVEKNLTFVGFLVLECPLKPDSRSVIKEIGKNGGDLSTVMVTGDAVLTAAEVARQVGIIRGSPEGRDRITYWLQEVENEIPSKIHGPLSRFCFVPLLEEKSGAKNLPLADSVSKLQALIDAGDASFCLTGDMLVQVATSVLATEEGAVFSEKTLLMHPRVQAVLKELVPIISVFARHAPHQKEAVVAAFNLAGKYTLYCGDGTNDTPSLKRAHVGISIISAPDAESKQRKANASLSRLKTESKRERKSQKKGKKAAGSNATRAKSMEESLRLLREAEELIDQVELGDASVASPFTSRQVSIVCCKKVLVQCFMNLGLLIYSLILLPGVQGRCTLVTMLQIYKILGINCLVNAMVLSTLSIHGVKQGDRQLTVLGVVVAALFFFVTRAKPIDALSKARPPPSVLCPHALLSIALQFAIHFGAILLACRAALAFVDPFDPSIVADGPFNPNVLNTCTFMLTVLSTINTFAVNYRGRPFTEGLKENTLMMRSLLVCYLCLFLCAFEAFPPLNDLLQLSSFPSDIDIEAGSNSLASDSVIDGCLSFLLISFGFPAFMCILMVGDTILSFLVEKLILRTFEGVQ